jgi:hypothetical protein
VLSKEPKKNETSLAAAGRRHRRERGKVVKSSIESPSSLMFLLLKSRLIHHDSNYVSVLPPRSSKCLRRRASHHLGYELISCDVDCLRSALLFARYHSARKDGEGMISSNVVGGIVEVIVIRCCRAYHGQ